MTILADQICAKKILDDGAVEDEVDNLFLILFQGWRCRAACCMNSSKVSFFRVSSCLQATLIGIVIWRLESLFTSRVASSAIQTTVLNTR